VVPSGGGEAQFTPDVLVTMGRSDRKTRGRCPLPIFAIESSNASAMRSQHSWEWDLGGSFVRPEDMQV